MLTRSLRLLYGTYAALAFATVIVPLCLLIIVGPTERVRRNTGRWGVKLAMLAAGTPIRVEGLEHLPDEPCICVANHASYLDGLVLTAALPDRFRFLVQHGAADWPLVGPTLRRMGVHFVNRGSAREAAAATRELLRYLKQGESLTIFAEGTFKRPPGLLPFHNGAFMIAAKASVPVVPTVIVGTRALFGEGARLPRPARVHIRVLPKLMAESSHREAVQNLRDSTRHAILAHCGEPDAAHTAHPVDPESAS